MRIVLLWGMFWGASRNLSLILKTHELHASQKPATMQLMYYISYHKGKQIFVSGRRNVHQIPTSKYQISIFFWVFHIISQKKASPYVRAISLYISARQGNKSLSDPALHRADVGTYCPDAGTCFPFSGGSSLKDPRRTPN